MKKRANIVLMVGLGVFLLVLNFVGSKTCESGESYRRCDGNNLVSGVCVDGSWAENKTPCSADTSCSFDACLSVNCSSGERNVCVGEYTYVRQVCGEDGVYQNKKMICDKGMKCNQTTGSCITETIGFRETGSLSSWDKYYLNVSDDPQLSGFMACTNEFDCNSMSVDAIVKNIKSKYDTSTPIKFIDASVEYVSKYLKYELYPPQQCGLTASNLIQERVTNCVGYSTLLVSILRHEKIPSRQVAGCVTVLSSPKCRTFAFEGGNLLRAGSIRSDQINGHAWAEVYTPDRGWITVDPTVGLTVSKCVGYSMALSYGGVLEHPQQVCYIEDYDDVEACKRF